MKRRRLTLVRPRGCRKPLGTTVRLAPEYEELVLEDARRLGISPAAVIRDLVVRHYERGLLVDELCVLVQQLLGQARVVEG